MALQFGYSFGAKLAAALGLAARPITKIVIECEVGDVVKVYVCETLVHGDQVLDAVASANLSENVAFVSDVSVNEKGNVKIG